MTRLRLALLVVLGLSCAVAATSFALTEVGLQEADGAAAGPVSLDDAYRDGRIITADIGAVEIQGTGGLVLGGTTQTLVFSGSSPTIGVPDNAAQALCIVDSTNDGLLACFSSADGIEQVILPQRNTPGTPQFECSPGEGMYCSADGTLDFSTSGVSGMSLTGSQLSIATLIATSRIQTPGAGTLFIAIAGTSSVAGALTLQPINATGGFLLDGGRRATDAAAGISAIVGRTASTTATGGNRVGGSVDVFGGDETAASGQRPGDVRLAYDSVGVTAVGLVGVGKAPSAGVELDVNGDVSLSGGLTISGTTLATSGLTASGAWIFSSSINVNGATTLSDTAGVNTGIGNSTGNVTIFADNFDLSCTDGIDNACQIKSSTGVNYLELDLGAADGIRLGNVAGTTVMNSSFWTIDASGNAAGFGTFAADGLATLSGGLTVSAGSVALQSGATVSGSTLVASASVDVSGVVRLVTEESAAPTEPVACSAATTGTIVYVDDTNDAGAAALCVCLDADDGTTLDWRRVDDHTAACPFF